MPTERELRRKKHGRRRGEGKPDTDAISMRRKAIEVQRFLKRNDPEMQTLEKAIVDAGTEVEAKEVLLDEQRKAVSTAEDKLMEYLATFIDPSFNKTEVKV